MNMSKASVFCLMATYLARVEENCLYKRNQLSILKAIHFLTRH